MKENIISLETFHGFREDFNIKDTCLPNRIRVVRLGKGYILLPETNKKNDITLNEIEKALRLEDLKIGKYTEPVSGKGMVMESQKRDINNILRPLYFTSEKIDMPNPAILPAKKNEKEKSRTNVIYHGYEGELYNLKLTPSQIRLLDWLREQGELSCDSYYYTNMPEVEI